MAPEKGEELAAATEQLRNSLRWFRTNQLLRKRLSTVLFSPHDLRVIDLFLAEDGEVPVDQVAEAASSLAATVRNEIGPQLDAEMRKMGRGANASDRLQLQMTRSTLGENTNVLENAVAAVQIARRRRSGGTASGV